MGKKVTMAQTAAAAGVSQPTVSLVLNGMADSMRIKESTRHKVLETAKQLGYQRVTPNSLQGKRRIAFVLDGAIITNDHFITALNEANVRANELGLVLCQLDTAGNERGRELVKKELQSGLYKGVIIATNVTTDDILAYDSGLPTVYLNCIPRDNLDVYAILPDDYGGAYDLTRLIAAKYQHPLIVAGDEWMRATIDRIRAMRAAFREQHVNITSEEIIYTDWSFKNAYTLTLEYLQDSSKQRPDVILCGSDFLATAVYQAVYKCGLSIPDDLAITGIDDQPLALNLTPTLTTVELPYSEMGSLAVDSLNQIIDLSDNRQQIKRLRGRVLVRESTKI